MLPLGILRIQKLGNVDEILVQTSHIDSLECTENLMGHAEDCVFQQFEDWL